METATVLVNHDEPFKHKFDYYKLELPESFYETNSHRDREDFRDVIRRCYQDITGFSYVMCKFDKIEKYFDQ